MDAAHASAAEKAAFFRQMVKPCVSDDEFDTPETEHRARCRGFFRPKQQQQQQPSAETSRHRGRRHETPRRVASDPVPLAAGKENAPRVIKATPASVMARRGRVGAMLDAAPANSSPSADDTVVVPDSTRPVLKTLRKSESAPLPVAKRLLGRSGTDMPSRAGGSKRRKRDSSPVKRPEEEQIFRGLAFFYVPDNDIAPARRIRISKAREYGATWTRMVSAATHIVVDRSIRYKDLQSTLARVEKSNPPKMVNEDYPIDCIQFRAVLDHNQKKYQVVGHPAVDDHPGTLQSSESSERSLPLKPPENNPRRWDYVPPGGTPSRGEESSQASRVAGTPAPTDSQPITLDIGPVATSPEAMSPDAEEPLATTEVTKDTASDELSEYISMMQEFKDLPLDRDEEDDSRSAVDTADAASESNEQSGSDAEQMRRRYPRRVATRNSRKNIGFEERFACNRAGLRDAGSDNPNARTIGVLQNMANYYDRVNDHWRTTAYRKAISTLKRQDTKITTEEEAIRLPMVGQRLAQKIEEIVTTDKLKRLEYAEAEPLDESLQLFMQIYGVGTRQAQQWVAQGFRTLDDLMQKAKLSTNQRIGIEHYDDLNKRIPRREVEALGAFVQKAAARIDPRVQLIIGGSYRRGAESSHDIDFIVTKPSTESSGDLVPFLDKLVQRLERDKFLVARLASSRSGHDGSKWHGCCVLPKMKGINDDNYQAMWRRIDFLLVPEPEMGAALLYFTGNDIFNRSMRLLASRKGMRLNQRGLYRDVLRGPNRAKRTEGELVEGRDEKRIFEILGVQWREPHERWC
ncbi:hypothetical protein ACO1O0_000632 [Amphichorda felina]